MIPIDYDMIVFKEDETYVAYCPEFDVSSCGNAVEHAKEMLKTAVRLFLEEADKMGILEDILEESRYKRMQAAAGCSSYCRPRSMGDLHLLYCV